MVISEHITRSLRAALPTSIRASADGSCIEWMPIRAASNYLDLPKGSSPSSFDAVPLAGGQAASGRIVVYGYGSNVYDISNPGPVSPPASVPAGSSPVTVTFDGGASHRFSARSPEKRFYVIGEPVALCQSGQWLYRYSNYGINTAVASGLPSSYPGRQVLSASLEDNSLVFEVTPPTLQRGAVVSFSFVLEDNETGESTAISQEVQIRNVP